ncbi:MAG TPA: MarR family winged helix-turn-helix transcriptional regulator [Steroidobacteraceae bacterium]|jgi:DNA-binding MarR family transcriptional regulator|nr:MarR family winged helix-turn-helix transcriptional regulator [Steroidobacteraceae bacterium]
MRQPYYSLESLEPDNSVGYLLKRCGILMHQVAERRFESLPITFSQWVVLVHLARQEHISATQLSAHLGHDMGALTRVVDELERLGFARRERSRRDRRAVEIAITAAGRREATNAKRVVVELLNRLVEPFTPREIDVLLGLLQRLHGHLQEAATPKGAAQSAPTLAELDRPRRARRKSAHGGAT